MPLGSNRDYKTADRRARNGLARHKQLMDELIAHGMSRLDASAQAFAEMEGKSTREEALLKLYPKSDLPTK